MDVPRDLVDQFVMLTHADVSVASQLLGDNHLNFEAAIASFFAIQEAGGAPTAASTAANPEVTDVDAAVTDGSGPAAGSPGRAPSDVVVVDGLADPALVIRAQALAADEAIARQLSEEFVEDDVRAPIPQHIDQILPGPAVHRTRGPTTRGNHVVNDPFLQSDGTAHGDTLSALFRPPVRLVYAGDFDQAMNTGQEEKRWILVNMQRTDVFQCHILNRDVWSDPAVHDLLQARFLFWQRDEMTEEGRRYKQFYPYGDPPHVAIIDPRSGERLSVWGGDGSAIKKDDIVNALVDFSDRYSLEEGHDRPTARPSSRQEAARTRPGPTRIRSGAGPSSTRLPSSSLDVTHSELDVMETEDAQIAAAIAASIEERGGTGPAAVPGEDDDYDVEVVDTNDDVVLLGSGPPQSHTAPALPTEMDRHASRILSATDPDLNDARNLRAQQDSEYEQSLALDRAKSESEKDEVARAQRAAAQVEAKRARLSVPPEANCELPTTELVIRLPSGRRLQRRFLASDTIGDVYDFVDIESGDELSDDLYALVLPFPRTTFADRSATLQESNLENRAALVVDKY
jgi:hypothetical protein